MTSIETNFTNKTIGEIVSEDIRAAKIFKRHGIDFCCGGKKNLLAACEEKQANIDVVQEELLDLFNRNNPRPEINPAKWKPGFLCDYIENIHHSYVKQNIPVISELATKVARVHGAHNPETVKINEVFSEIAKELSTHLQKEELILFPYIKKIEAATENKALFAEPHFGTVKKPIVIMEQEHEAAGELMEEIYLLSNHFEPPDYACNSYRLLYNSLAEFREDLHRHIHLENNILFPKAITLETQVKRN